MATKELGSWARVCRTDMQADRPPNGAGHVILICYGEFRCTQRSTFHMQIKWDKLSWAMGGLDKCQTRKSIKLPSNERIDKTLLDFYRAR